MQHFERLSTQLKTYKLMHIFTWGTRVLLFFGFLPSGLKKLLGERFTLLGTETPIGFFFEALYQTGFYWNFLGFMQIFAGLLLLIPRTAFMGALIYLPIIINILIIVVSMQFRGTPFVVALMLLANLYLIFWDYKKLKAVVSAIFAR